MKLDVSTFEYPDRFFVEAETNDRDYVNFLNCDDNWIPPHFVDLSEPYCSCRDWNYNVLPYIHQDGARKTCKHIDAAIRYRREFAVRLTTLPERIKL